MARKSKTRWKTLKKTLTIKNSWRNALRSPFNQLGFICHKIYIDKFPSLQLGSLKFDKKSCRALNTELWLILTLKLICILIAALQEKLFKKQGCISILHICDNYTFVGSRITDKRLILHVGLIFKVLSSTYF